MFLVYLESSGNMQINVILCSNKMSPTHLIHKTVKSAVFGILFIFRTKISDILFTSLFLVFYSISLILDF